MGGIAARGEPTGLRVDPGCGLPKRQALVDEGEDAARRRAGIEGPVAVPGQVAPADVPRVEPLARPHAFGHTERHPNRPTDPVPGSETQGHASRPLLGCGHRPTALSPL